jgi:hypothetical protein
VREEALVTVRTREEKAFVEKVDESARWIVVKRTEQWAGRRQIRRKVPNVDIIVTNENELVINDTMFKMMFLKNKFRRLCNITSPGSGWGGIHMLFRTHLLP